MPTDLWFDFFISGISSGSAACADPNKFLLLSTSSAFPEGINLFIIDLFVLRNWSTFCLFCKTSSSVCPWSRASCSAILVTKDLKPSSSSILAYFLPSSICSIIFLFSSSVGFNNFWRKLLSSAAIPPILQLVRI